MTYDARWRVFFMVAAAFNFVVGAPLLIAPGAMAAILGLPVPDDVLFHRFTGLLVICFGIAYSFVAQDPQRNRAIVWTGIVGKAGVVALYAQAWLQGAVPFQAFAVSFGDIAFIGGFVAFLITHREAK